MLTTNSPWLAAGRHVITAAATAVTVLTGVAVVAGQLHVLNVEQIGQLTNAFSVLGDSVTKGVGAIGVIAGVLSASWGAWSATHSSQAASVAATGAVVVTDPATAAAVPSPNVVSNTDVKVVPK